jgi:hypothetical protein
LDFLYLPRRTRQGKACAPPEPAGRGSGATAVDTRAPAERHRARSWAQRLKRVFKLDLESCENCGGRIRVIACLEDQLSDLLIAPVWTARKWRKALPESSLACEARSTCFHRIARGARMLKAPSDFDKE